MGLYRFSILAITLCGLNACAVPDVDFVNTYHAGDNARDNHPVVATDRTGNWVTAWSSEHPLGSLGTDWDMFQSYSRTNGRQWTNVTPLNFGASNDGKFGDVEPTLAFAGKTGVAVWSSGNNLNGTIGEDLDLWFSRSPGMPLGGWKIEQPIDKGSATVDGAFDDDRQADIATDGKGNWVVTWVRQGLGDADIFRSTSGNDGVTWSTSKTLNHDAASDTHDDFSPAVATDKAGRWLVVWSRKSGGAFNSPIYHATSTNNGATWSNSKPIHGQAFGDSPRLACHGKTCIVVWHSNIKPGSSDIVDPNIHFSRTIDGGLSWSGPAYLNSDWNDTSGLGIWGRHDFNADVETDGKGNWAVVWELWKATSLTASDLRIAFSKNNGVDWTKPAYVNPKWDSDKLSEKHPRIATDGQGNWVVVSQHAAHISGNTAMDSEIAVHRLEFPAP